MGAWGPGSFDNDDALDWVADLHDDGDVRMISMAFDEADEGEIELPEAASIIAAAETVAAMNGRPSADLPGEAADWLAANRPRPDAALTARARAAVAAVRAGSELKELWEQHDSTGWYAALDDLLHRLA